ncbi:MAG TPA: peptidylprolyl isomerase [Thermoanaerobaculia bacterium]|nr:peptidylprolyl isomerase [Thermoanaerobaculia bacterium]
MKLSLAAVVTVLALGAASLSAQAPPAAAKANPRVALETSKGKIVIEVYQDKAPKSAANFLQYVRSGFYDGVIFHRVIPDFMIQTGGFTPDMKQKATKGAIQNEADNGLRNERGTLAMARLGEPHSATAQFFINLKDNRALDHTGKNQRGWGYAVFGKVVEGMDVVDAIATVRTATRDPHGDVPVEPILINKASVVPIR